MTEKPILFNAEMVRAVLSGNKTQTRRTLKPAPLPQVARWIISDHWWIPEAISEAVKKQFITTWPNAIKCPYGQAGDQLWVRETWSHDCYPYPLSNDPFFHYRADYLDDPLGADLEHSLDGIRRKWLPSIHMPRKASRIQLEITNVRVERLQDISEEDAIAEGIQRVSYRPLGKGNPIDAYSIGKDDGRSNLYRTAQEAYKKLWQSINGAESWQANPWVWVIEFKKL